MYYPITTEKWDWMAPEYRKDYIVSRTAPPSQLQLGGMGEGTSDRSVGAGAGATTDDLLLRHQHQSHHHQRPSTAPHHARIGSSSSGSGGRYEEGGSGSGSDSPTGTIRSKASLRSPAKLRSQSLRSTNPTLTTPNTAFKLLPKLLSSFPGASAAYPFNLAP